jgi:hypothetical protein
VNLYRVYIMEGDGSESKRIAMWERFGTSQEQTETLALKAAIREWPEKAEGLWVDSYKSAPRRP